MDELIVPTPATDRMRWLLEGLAGDWPAGMDPAGVFAPSFAAQVPPERFVAVMRQRAVAVAPYRLVGLDVEDSSAQVRFRSRDGEAWVARVDVEPEPPYRIVLGYAQPSALDYLNPPLPDRFAVEALPEPGRGQFLIAFAGVPGSGKSALAERLGTELGVAVLSIDWAMGALSPFGLRHRDDLMRIGEEILTTLAYRELAAGRSLILDSSGEDPAVRERWQSLAARIRFVPVICVCSDPAVHRRRVETRTRGIPGWTDAGDWHNVQLRLAAFPAWPGALTVDSINPLRACASHVRRTLDDRRPATRAASTPDPDVRARSPESSVEP